MSTECESDSSTGQENRVIESICRSVSLVKRTKFGSLDCHPSQYLGGDLGITSLEMLEVWFEIEQILGVTVDDEEKRDVFTVGQVCQLLTLKLERQ